METIQSNKQKVSWIAGGAALLIVIIFGWVLRFQASMTTELIPGINGAYYPLQVRSILESGTLGIPDFPLLFYVDAAFALLLTLFIEQNQAIVLATRLVDLVIPVLIAVPVMLFAFEFSKDRKKSYLTAAATLLVGLIAVGNTSLLRLSGDFQKNAVALPFSLLFLFFLYRSFAHHKKRDYVMAVIFFVITSLTHLGVTALTLTVGGLFAIITLASDPNRKRSILIISGLVLIALLTLTAVYLIDPTRIERLLSVILDPYSLFADLSQETANAGKTSRRIFIDERLLLGNILGLVGIMAAILMRAEINKTTRTLLWSSSLTALLFASSFINPAWSQRLALMAFLPGLIPLTFLVMRRKWGWGIAAAVLIFVLGTTFTTPGVFSQKTLSIDAYAELEEMKDLLEPGSTLVYAAHGLEWWVGWTMDTEITNRFYLAAENWDEYDAVYSLTQTNPTAFSNGSRPSTQDNPKNGISPSNLGNQPPSRTPDQNQQQITDLVFAGEFFSLVKISEQPAINKGGGEPALEGLIEDIGTGWLLVDGSQVVYNDETTFSAGYRESIPETLTVNSQVMIWGEWEGLFKRELQASHITKIPENQFDPGAQRPEKPPENQVRPDEPESDEQQVETVQLGPLTMITRTGWQAEPLNLNAQEENGVFDAASNPNGVLTYTQPLVDWITTIVVHHSALPTSKGPAEIQALHQDKAGYADIGYHFIIGEDGMLYQGRPIQIRGAHTEGFNTGTVGVVLLGNFENSKPTSGQIKTLIQLVILLKNRFQITHIAGHADFNPEITVCPGENLAAFLPQIATRVGLSFGIEGYQPPPWDTP